LNNKDILMSQTDDDFFEGKRPWSIIKDNVLKSYMTPYIAKVNRLRQPILLIDGYAGPGAFMNGEPGSPLIMCQAAEKYARGNYQAIFVNKNPEHHAKLTDVLQKAGWSQSAHALLGDSSQLIRKLPDILTSHTVFLYLDPFGLKGCEFDTLQPFLQRDKQFSTEIVLTLSMPIVHRLASRHAVEEGRINEPRIQTFHDRLTRVFGGNYWKDSMLTSPGDTEKREQALIEEYRSRLAHYLPYSGFCPVREKIGSRTKYFMLFASRHPDTMRLMNDAMHKAYFVNMHRQSFAGTLFESEDWRDTRELHGLQACNLSEAILEIVRSYPGKTRTQVWDMLIQKYFMRFTESEYKQSVQALIDEEKLTSPTPRPTRRLNDKCVLYIT
jgi:three-Cys-motif partner protein